MFRLLFPLYKIVELVNQTLHSIDTLLPVIITRLDPGIQAETAFEAF